MDFNYIYRCRRYIKELKLWINNLPFNITEQVLYSIFGEWANVKSVHIQQSKGSKYVKSCQAHVKFYDLEEMLRALKKLNNTSIGGQTITIELAYSAAIICKLCKKFGHYKDQCWNYKKINDDYEATDEVNNHLYRKRGSLQTTFDFCSSNSQNKSFMDYSMDMTSFSHRKESRSGSRAQKYKKNNQNKVMNINEKMKIFSPQMKQTLNLTRFNPFFNNEKQIKQNQNDSSCQTVYEQTSKSNNSSLSFVRILGEEGQDNQCMMEEQEKIEEVFKSGIFDDFEDEDGPIVRIKCFKQEEFEQ